MAELDLDLNPELNPEYNSKNIISRIAEGKQQAKEKQLPASPVRKTLKEHAALPKNVIPANVLSIIDAKHDWESTVDCINEFAILLLDSKLNVVRVNKTVEKWGWCKVSKVQGYNVYDLLEPIIAADKRDEFYRFWLNIDINKVSEWESKYNTTGRIYKFTFYPVKNKGKYSTRNSKCYMTLVAEDITEKKKAVFDLKGYVSELELKLIRKNQKLLYAKKSLEHKLKKEELAKKKLEESKKQLHHLSNQLITAQERERKSVSRELHDGVGQIISAIKYQIEGAILANKAASEKSGSGIVTSTYILEEVLSNVKAAFVEVRRLSVNLRPSMLDELGVITTLAWFAKDFNKVYSDIVIDQQVSVKEENIPEKAKIVIFRIVQESMNNIAKYAKASQIRIQLFKKGEMLILRVIDDGQGFDIKEIEQQHKFGLGLKSMQERADSINGKLTIRSIINTGTTIELAFNGK